MVSKAGKNGWDFSDVGVEKWVKLGWYIVPVGEEESSVEMLLHLGASRVPVVAEEASHIRRKLRPANICLRASWEQRIITPYNTLLLASLFPQLNLFLHRNQNQEWTIENCQSKLLDWLFVIHSKITSQHSDFSSIAARNQWLKWCYLIKFDNLKATFASIASFWNKN